MSEIREEDDVSTPEFREIDLRGPIRKNADMRELIGEDAVITFLCAEVSREYRLPFALIRYSVDGKEQEYGLRLDIDKRVFIDNANWPGDQAASRPDDQPASILSEVAPAIVEILGADQAASILRKVAPGIVEILGAEL